MTTQFVQQVPFTFSLKLAPDNSYFVLLPREIGINTNKCMSFYGYVSFVDYNSILPHYSPPTPVDFGQFGASWCEESLTAYLNSIGLSSYKKQFHYEGVMFQNNGNNLSAQGINNALLVGRLEINNQIDTDFDNLFTNLISSLNTLLTPISQISLSLLGINNLFPTLVHNLQALNENNVPVSIAEILRDKQIDVDMSEAEVSLDDTNLVTQLQNIYTILSSQNSNQSAISSAIQNKDNQSNIIDELRFIFTNTISNGHPYRMLNGQKNFSAMKNNTEPVNNDNIGYYGAWLPMLAKICSLLSTSNSTTIDTNTNVGNKSIFRVFNTKLDTLNTALQNIETKLEQNLPFATLTDVTLNVDTVKKCVTQDIKENSEI